MTEQSLMNRVMSKLVIGGTFQSFALDRRTNKRKIRQVVAFYPHYVLTTDDQGFMECFLYFDLCRMLEMQEGE